MLSISQKSVDCLAKAESPKQTPQISRHPSGGSSIQLQQQQTPSSMIDSWGTLPSGLLYENVIGSGNCDECLGINEEILE
ncbi:hypothetical protein ACLKA6_019458 [Drosophila palustris]